MDEDVSFFDSVQFREGLKKVGPGAKFFYRSKYDPLTDEEYRIICEYEEGKERLPNLYAVIGPNGSGKSTCIANTRLPSICPSIINPDNYARKLTDIENEYDRYVVAMNQCAAMRRSLLNDNVDFGFETVGSREDKIEFIRDAKSKGYRIFIEFITVSSPEICIKRIQERVKMGGHDVPVDKVRSRYARTMGYLRTYLRLADEAIVLDNSGSSPVEVIRKQNGLIKIFDTEDNPSWIRNYL